MTRHRPRLTSCAVTALAEADAIAADDVWTNKQIGLNALALVPQSATIIHHCNTGSLATVDYGTALGVIRTAHEQGRTCTPISTRRAAPRKGRPVGVGVAPTGRAPHRHRGRRVGPHHAHARGGSVRGGL
ncbi:MAG: hypothetical protein R2851_24615 [Caldilineaceae bacterium]